MTPVTAAPDVSTLSYEQARDELVDVVGKLESGAASLEESLTLWERGEALADRCQAWLDTARDRLAAAQSAREGEGSDGDGPRLENSGPEGTPDEDEETQR
nr:exodeoxyribonuclease VII small subunit [Ruania alba]